MRFITSAPLLFTILFFSNYLVSLIEFVISLVHLYRLYITVISLSNYIVLGVLSVIHQNVVTFVFTWTGSVVINLPLHVPESFSN